MYVEEESPCVVDCVYTYFVDDITCVCCWPDSLGLVVLGQFYRHRHGKRPKPRGIVDI